jgi:hypothetical protein
VIDFRTRLQLEITEDEKNLSVAKIENEKKENYRKAYEQACSDYHRVIETSKLIDLVYDVTCRKANEFREGRLKELVSRAEAVLDLAFPGENFGIKIINDRKYGEDIAGILVGKKGTPESEWFSPVTENGGFVQQLIATSLIVSICLMSNADFIFLDEMFCSGDPTSVANIKPFFDSILQNNIQLTIIEHKPTLYENINRREFHLAKDREVGSNVHLLKVEDVTI